MEKLRADALTLVANGRLNWIKGWPLLLDVLQSFNTLEIAYGELFNGVLVFFVIVLTDSPYISNDPVCRFCRQ